jgi:hypothetical protein
MKPLLLSFIELRWSFDVVVVVVAITVDEMIRCDVNNIVLASIAEVNGKRKKYLHQPYKMKLKYQHDNGFDFDAASAFFEKKKGEGKKPMLCPLMNFRLLAACCMLLLLLQQC